MCEFDQILVDACLPWIWESFVTIISLVKMIKSLLQKPNDGNKKCYIWYPTKTFNAFVNINPHLTAPNCFVPSSVNFHVRNVHVQSQASFLKERNHFCFILLLICETSIPLKGKGEHKQKKKKYSLDAVSSSGKLNQCMSSDTQIFMYVVCILSFYG